MYIYIYIYMYTHMYTHKVGHQSAEAGVGEGEVEEPPGHVPDSEGLPLLTILHPNPSTN